MKKIVTLLLAVVLAFGCMSLVACGDKEDEVKLDVCIASEPDVIDPALNSSVDGATLCIHLFSGLVKYNQAGELVADCAKSLPTATANQDGTSTYVFEIKDGLKWSNGDALKASDFEWSWKRAASASLGADYGYMFDIIKGYGGDDYEKDAQGNPIYYEVDEDGEYVLDEAGNKVVGNADNGALLYVGVAPLAVVADDTANTLTVTLNVDVPYFFELCAFPAYLPVNKATVEENGDSWCTDPDTFVSNGAYTMKEWKHNSSITLVKNDNYHDADNVTMPKVVFHLSDSETTMLANFKNGSWLFIDDVPTNEIKTLSKEYGENATDASKKGEYVVGSQLGTYYINFNINLDLLPSGYVLKAGETKLSANTEIKKALALLLDRVYICDSIGQAGQVPASSFVALGLTDASNNGEQFYKHAGSSSEYFGYYDAYDVESTSADALATLKKYYDYDESTGKFTNFPEFTYLYNTNEGHQKIAEYVQAALAAYGIPVECENQEWNTFLNTRKDGDYGVSRNGWLGDYNDPISFLDMWLTTSGNNDVQYGKAPTSAQITSGKYFDASTANAYSMDLSSVDGYAQYSVTNGTWAQTYDVLIGLIKNETDQVKRFKLMHIAEDMLMESGCICPLYYYTDIYMIDQSVEGFFASPLGYKYFMYTTIKK